jgi:hypothetical protein
VQRRPARRALGCIATAALGVAANGIARRHTGGFGDGQREGRERPLDIGPLRLPDRRGAYRCRGLKDLRGGHGKHRNSTQICE